MSNEDFESSNNIRDSEVNKSEFDKVNKYVEFLLGIIYHDQENLPNKEEEEIISNFLNDIKGGKK